MIKKAEFVKALTSILKRTTEVKEVFSNFDNYEDELICEDMEEIVKGINKLFSEIKIGTYDSIFEEK